MLNYAPQLIRNDLTLTLHRFNHQTKNPIIESNFASNFIEESEKGGE